MPGMNGLEAPEGRTARRDAIKQRRRALEEELRSIQEQRAALEGQLHKLRAQHRPEEPPAQAAYAAASPAVGKKRPAAREAAPAQPAYDPSKRQRLHTERDKRVASLFGQCATIVKGLMKSREAYPFCKPVDVVALKIPDYYNIIKRPMDLGTVMRKLEHKPERGMARQYKSPLDLRDDVRLVWQNCRTYNQPGNPVRKYGENLSDAWEKKWAISGLEKKWEEELQRQQDEERVRHLGRLCRKAYNDPSVVLGRRLNTGL